MNTLELISFSILTIISVFCIIFIIIFFCELHFMSIKRKSAKIKPNNKDNHKITGEKYTHHKRVVINPQFIEIKMVENL